MNYWYIESKLVVKALLARHGVTYCDLAARLEAIGVHTSVAAITSRLHRGTISLAFLLQISKALNIKSIDLGD
jgi:hypothetical protein